jgi:hypothetical protein
MMRALSFLPIFLNFGQFMAVGGGGQGRYAKIFCHRGSFLVYSYHARNVRPESCRLQLFRNVLLRVLSYHALCGHPHRPFLNYNNL